jgi:hypothetical protein
MELQTQTPLIEQPTFSSFFVRKVFAFFGIFFIFIASGIIGYFLGQKQINTLHVSVSPTLLPAQIPTPITSMFKKTSGYEKFVVGKVDDPRIGGLRYINYPDYSFSYPKNWDIFVDNNRKLVIVTSIDNAKTLRETLYGGGDGGCHPLGPITVSEISEQELENNVVKQYPNESVTSKPTIVDTLPAMEYITSLSFDPCGSSSIPNEDVWTIIIVKLKNRIFEISLSDSVDPEKQALFDKFLTTFHFLSK